MLLGCVAGDHPAGCSTSHRGRATRLFLRSGGAFARPSLQDQPGKCLRALGRNYSPAPVHGRRRPVLLTDGGTSLVSQCLARARPSETTLRRCNCYAAFRSRWELSGIRQGCIRQAGDAGLADGQERGTRSQSRRRGVGRWSAGRSGSGPASLEQLLPSTVPGVGWNGCCWKRSSKTRLDTFAYAGRRAD